MEQITMSLDALEELAKQDGMEFLDLSKKNCFEYVRQHLGEDTSHYNDFMRGCYDYLTGARPHLKLFRSSSDDWRFDRRYGYNYAKYLRERILCKEEEVK